MTYNPAMHILGHGIDLVDVARIGEMIDRHGDRFLQRCFTDVERAYCEASTKRRHEHLAARFAAKEAVLKALGTGWRDGIAWTDIEVVREPSGRPTVKLTGEAANIASRLGVQHWHVSLTHTETQAMASAIATGV
jgi:holo-[acyl-carrier protein] synthase